MVHQISDNFGSFCAEWQFIYILMALNLVNNKKYCNIWTLWKTNQLKYYTKALICITHLSLKLKMSETLMLFSKKNRWILESYQTSNTFLLSKSYNYLGEAHVVRHWEPLFTFSKKKIMSRLCDIEINSCAYISLISRLFCSKGWSNYLLNWSDLFQKMNKLTLRLKWFLWKIWKIVNKTLIS